MGRNIIASGAVLLMLCMTAVAVFAALDARRQLHALRREPPWVSTPVPADVDAQKLARMEHRLADLEADLVEALNRGDAYVEQLVAEKLHKVHVEHQQEEMRRRHERLFQQIRPDMQGFIGVQVSGYEADVAAHFGIDEPIGALVINVIPLSPADKAGLRSLDLITVVNGQNVEDAFQFRRLVRRLPPGSRARVELLRMRQGRKQRLTLPVPVADFKEWIAVAENPQRVSMRIHVLERQLKRLEAALNALSTKTGHGRAVEDNEPRPSIRIWSRPADVGEGEGKQQKTEEQEEQKPAKPEDLLEEW